MNIQTYTIREASECLHTSQNVMRRLWDSGLIPGVRRNRLGHRIFDESQLNHARIMLGLRNAGLKKSELSKYTNLARQGDATLPERKAMLETEKRQAWQRLEDIHRDIDFLERQIELIDQQL